MGDELNKEIMAKIRQRRAQILIHSSIYYTFDDNIVPDFKYDNWAKELVYLQHKYPKESKAVKFFQKEFSTYEGSTGFDLPINNVDVREKAKYLLKLRDKNKGM